jgi:hypothetical protein
MTSSISPAMRMTLPCMAPTSIRARSSSGVLTSRRPPAWIEASGLRRSCPSTAMNCSRSSAAWRSLSSSAWLSARRSSLSMFWAIIWANSLNMPITCGFFSCAGLGSMAQSVPKNFPWRKIGWEM